MDITITEQTNRTAVIALNGRVDAFNAPAIRQQMETQLDSGVRNFVLDLSDVQFLDSSGLAVLVSLLKRATQDGGDVKMVLPKLEAALRILRLTRFDRVFTIIEAP